MKIYRILCLVFLPGNVSAFFNGMPAEQVFGQIDFAQVQANQGVSASSRTLRFPSAVHVGTYGGTKRLFVLDRENNRALVYNLPKSTADAAADAVIGQPDFISTDNNQGGGPSSTTLNLSSLSGLTGDGTNIFISDLNNHRVLIYLDIAAKIAAFPGTPIAADFVIGQPDFISSAVNNGGRSAKSLNGPQAVFAVKVGAATKLLIVDRDNYRVLVYNDIPASDFAAADLVIGQANFGTPTVSVTQSLLRSPLGVWSDGTKVAVAEDSSANRVMLWDTFPTVNGKAADRVIGQSSFVGNTANAFGADDARSLSGPASVFFDGTRLFVGSPLRVMIYDEWPVATFSTPADIVIGRKGFTGKTQAPAIRVQPNNALGGLFKDGDDLYVNDQHNHRILVFPDTFGIYQVSPGSVTFGSVALEVLGDDFPAGSTVALRRTGQPDVPGTSLSFSSVTLIGRYKRLTADFDLSGAKAGDWDIVLTSGALSHTLAGAITLAPFTLTESLPNFGYDHAAATLFIKGTNIPTGATLRLTRSGQTDIVATDAVYHSTAVVQASFNLQRRAHGLWNIAVSSGANTVMLANSFVIGRFPFGAVIIEATKSMSGSAAEVLTISVSNNGLANSTLHVPAGAIPGSLTIDVSMGAILSPPPAPPGFVFFKTPIEMSPSGMEFSSQVSLEVPYEPSDLTDIGLASAAGLVAKTYNTMTGAWEDVTTTVDTSNKKVRIDTIHFSAFGIMAAAASDFSQLNIFPNPFVPSSGHGAVRFTNLPPGSSVRLYTMSGDMLRELADGGSGTLSWDGTNSSGNPASSGVYVAVIGSPVGGTRRLLAIER